MSAAPTAVDCLIIGGGPAGLTAAIYAARFRLTTLVIDAGASRARLIPCTHNHAGFPEGVSGAELVDRMGRQAVRYGASLARQSVVSLERAPHGLVARTQEAAYEAFGVILATGVVNHRPWIDPAVHDGALARGALRYCPVCDGFEAADQNIAVVGGGERAAREALFLRSFSRRVTLAPDTAQGAELDEAWASRLADAGVARRPGPARDFALEDGGLAFDTGQGRERFDTVYPAMGSTSRSELAAQVGAALTAEGCVRTDDHQRTNVPGLYAAGDVVIGLDQISHAMGQAGVAATTLRNDLAERRTLWR